MSTWAAGAGRAPPPIGSTGEERAELGLVGQQEEHRLEVRRLQVRAVCEVAQARDPCRRVVAHTVVLLEEHRFDSLDAVAPLGPDDSEPSLLRARERGGEHLALSAG